jgi:hypothetical protein
MIINVQKYRYIVGQITLFSYLLIFTLNIFHFHSFELDATPAIDVGNELYPQSQISVSEFRCLIHQNFSSLHTLAISNSSYFIFNDNTKPAQPIGISHAEINQITLSINHLRAPPFFS